MSTGNENEGLRETATARLARLVRDNPAETAGFAGLVVWLDALAHQSSILRATFLPALLSANAETIGLTTSLLTAMAAAACLYFLIANGTHALADATIRMRTRLSAWWLSLAMIVCIVLSIAMVIASGSGTSFAWAALQSSKSLAILVLSLHVLHMLARPELQASEPAH